MRRAEKGRAGNFVRRWLPLLLAAAVCGQLHAQQGGWRPERSIELVSPSGPGGLNDLMLRNMQNVMQAAKLVDVPITVSNKSGAGGVLALTYVSQHPGDPHYLTPSTVNMLSNHILGQGALNYTDFTPLGHLMHTYIALAVKPDSPLTSSKEVFARLRKDPESLAISVGTSRGNASHVALALAAKAEGADPRRMRIVIFKSAAEALAALLGGHIDLLVSALPNYANHVQNRNLRVLSIAAPERIPGLFGDVPTLREHGINVTISTWRGAMGPKGLQPAQVAWWEAVIGRLVDSEQWRKELAREFATRTRMSAAENRDFLAAEYRNYLSALTDLGMAKAK